MLKKCLTGRVFWYFNPLKNQNQNQRYEVSRMGNLPGYEVRMDFPGYEARVGFPARYQGDFKTECVSLSNMFTFLNYN